MDDSPDQHHTYIAEFVPTTSIQGLHANPCSAGFQTYVKDSVFRNQSGNLTLKFLSSWLKPEVPELSAT